jgi:siderophore synthetase component
MQNVIIVFSKYGEPVKVVLRDLELTRLVECGSHPDQDYKNLSCSAEFGWTRFAYCLLVNNLCEAISTLSHDNHALYLKLWGVLRYVMQSYLANYPSAEAALRIRSVLAGEPLPVKGNLLTRFLRQPDRQAKYLPLHHPLGVVNGICPANYSPHHR